MTIKRLNDLARFSSTDLIRERVEKLLGYPDEDEVRIAEGQLLRDWINLNDLAQELEPEEFEEMHRDLRESLLSSICLTEKDVEEWIEAFEKALDENGGCRASRTPDPSSTA